MPTPTKGPRLGGSPAHEKLILANLATELFRHGKIKTTETKAKRLRPLAEQLITKAKRGDLHARRRVLTRRAGQGRRVRPVRADRAAVRQPAGRLHPDHQDRSAQGRRRSDGDHRAGRGAAGRGHHGAGQEGRPQGRRAAGQGRGARPARTRPRRRRPAPAESYDRRRRSRTTSSRTTVEDQDAEPPVNASGDKAPKARRPGRRRRHRQGVSQDRARHSSWVPGSFFCTGGSGPAPAEGSAVVVEPALPAAGLSG